MKILIIGAAGMLGHKLWMSYKDRHDVTAAFHSATPPRHPEVVFDPARAVTGLDAADPAAMADCLDSVRPDAVVNCAGIIKQSGAIADKETTIRVNSLLPHRLAGLCSERKIRLVHISTDCVFDGVKGHYTEDDTPCPSDFYGTSKLMGEVRDSDNAITLRTSIIGNELFSSFGLLEWLLSQKGKRVKGFDRAIYTGFTTLEMARIILTVLERFPAMKGLWQVSSEAITKYDLLRLIVDKFKLDIAVDKDEKFGCDRSLDSARFRKATGYAPPSWDAMIGELAGDQVHYPSAASK